MFVESTEGELQVETTKIIKIRRSFGKTFFMFFRIFSVAIALQS